MGSPRFLFPGLALGCTLAALLAGGPQSAVAAGGRPEDRSLADRLRLGPGVANHPVGVVPSAAIRVPGGWPLGPGGSLTCLTCHVQLPSLEAAAGVRLRAVDYEAGGLEFCRNCHGAVSGEASAKGQHWLAVGRAHVMDNAEPLRWSGSVDSQSRRCLECHDGVNAVDGASTTARNRGPGSVGDPRRNHPVGVPYPPHAKRGGAERFRPAARLPISIRLPEGKVSCVSCHDLYALDRNRLTVPIEGSTLCFSCHDMN